MTNRWTGSVCGGVASCVADGCFSELDGGVWGWEGKSSSLRSCESGTGWDCLIALSLEGSIFASAAAAGTEESDWRGEWLRLETESWSDFSIIQRSVMELVVFVLFLRLLRSFEFFLRFYGFWGSNPTAEIKRSFINGYDRQINWETLRVKQRVFTRFYCLYCCSTLVPVRVSDQISGFLGLTQIVYVLGFG